MTEDDHTADLTKDLTRDLTDSEKLDFLIRAVTLMDARLQKVEAFVDDKSRDTSPMLDRIYKEVADQGRNVREIRNDLKVIHERLNLEGRERFDLAGRVAALESRPS